MLNKSFIANSVPASKINVFKTRVEMGNVAGKDIENQINFLLQKQDEVRIVFAAAPSQDEVLAYLATSKRIDWKRIIAFHMDEYIGLNGDSPQLFSAYLKRNLFDKVKPQEVHLIDTNVPLGTEITRYANLISEKTIDIICLGIGENGHIAFNDPGVANFKDDKIIKKVTLDEMCRLQQVNDGCFRHLEEVPKTALTLTIPVLMGAGYLFCVVPGANKRGAAFNTLNDPINENCPATILRTHSNCRFYFDQASYPNFEE